MKLVTRSSKKYFVLKSEPILTISTKIKMKTSHKAANYDTRKDNLSKNHYAKRKRKKVP